MPSLPVPPSSSPSMVSKTNTHRLPLALLSAALFFQLYVTPRAFPPHYDVSLQLSMEGHEVIIERNTYFLNYIFNLCTYSLGILIWKRSLCKVF